MCRRNFFLAVVVALCSISVDQLAADPHVRRDPFLLPHFAEEFYQPFVATPPEDTLAVLGLRSRTIAGRLIDGSGKAISGMPVAVQNKQGARQILECAKADVQEHLDVTDDEGRFSVEATMESPVLVFFSTDGLYLLIDPDANKDGSEYQWSDYQWPEATELKWSVPSRYALPGQQVYFCQQGLWSDRIQPVYTTQVSDDGQVGIQLLPGDYSVCIEAVEHQMIVGQHQVMVELSRFSVTPDMTRIPDVPLHPDGAVMGGNCHSAPEKHYVIVTQRHRKIPRGLLTQEMAVDMVRPASDGFFLTRKLPPGAYTVKLVSTNAGASPRFPVKEWRLRIQAGDPAINLNDIPTTAESTDESVRGRIEKILSTRKGYSGIHYLLEDVSTDQDLLTRTLFQVLNDRDCPADWRSPIRNQLFHHTKTTTTLIDGIVDTILHSHDIDSQRQAMGRVFHLEDHADRVIRGLRPLLERDDSFRRSFLIALSRIADQQPEQAEIVNEFFKSLLDHADPNVRLQAAGALTGKERHLGLQYLKSLNVQPSDDDYEYVVYCICRNTGNYDDYFTLALRELRQSGLYPRLRTCIQLQEIAKQQPLPNTIQAELGKLATSTELMELVSRHHQSAVVRLQELAAQLQESN